jgi:hypothetical protein
MPKPNLIEVEVQVEIKLWVSKTIKAENLADGLTQAQELKATDIVSLKGLCHNDDSIKVTGVFIA